MELQTEQKQTLEKLKEVEINLARIEERSKYYEKNYKI